MKNENRTASDTVIHASELENRCEYAPAVSSFLTPAEQATLWQSVRYPHRLFFWGGFVGAERRAAVFLPEWASDGAPYGDGIRFDSPEREIFLRDMIYGDDAPFDDIGEGIVLLDISGSGHRVLGHKDILGSLMGLGITRQAVGDICMLSDFHGVAVISGKLSDYIFDELSKVGRDGVKVSFVENPKDFTFERQFEEIGCTVASLRLDGIVSALTGLSRTKSAEHITAGLVQLSGVITDEGSAEVAVGDTVTVRGYGKFLIDSTDGVTRKSRIRLNVKKYV